MIISNMCIVTGTWVSIVRHGKNICLFLFHAIRYERVANNISHDGTSVFVSCALDSQIWSKNYQYVDYIIEIMWLK